MPPSTSHILADLGRRSDVSRNLTPAAVKRQSTPPTCATTCLLAAPTTDCPSGFSDGACLCSSSTFLSSAESCWQSTCTDGNDLTDAYSYGEYFCAQYGITITPSSTSAAASGSASVTGTSRGSTSSSSSTTASVTTTDVAASSASASLSASSNPTGPVTTSIDPMFKIDAIMGSICAFILACALIVGFSACRGRYKREKQESEIRSRSQWTTQGGTNTVGGGLRVPDDTRKNDYGFISRNGAGRAGQTSTIQIAHATRSHHQMTHLDTTGFIGLDELDPIQSVDEQNGVGIASTLGAGASTIDFDDISPSSERFLIDGKGKGKGTTSASASGSSESIPLETLDRDGKKSGGGDGGGAVPDNWEMNK